jgi:hypothetical protein
VRCLLIAPYGVDLKVLLTVLGERGAEVVSASELGTGAALALVALECLLIDFTLAGA